MVKLSTEPMTIGVIRSPLSVFKFFINYALGELAAHFFIGVQQR